MPREVLLICFRLAQARTGTGKTLAFLIPVLQNIISKRPNLQKRITRFKLEGRVDLDIRAIIISPTRELAQQIAVEAKRVAINTGVIVQTAVGGTGKVIGLRKIQKLGCHVLVGTPGRLDDILSDPYGRIEAPNLSALVLDEGDRLLDQGFAPQIKRIQDLLPDRRTVDRQTLLFSATIPQEVISVVKKTMKHNRKTIMTVKKSDQQTNQKVPQNLVYLNGLENQIPALVELCLQELQDPDAKSPFKAIVFFNASADVSLAAAILRQLQPQTKPTIPHSTKIIEIHARLSQLERNHASRSFRTVRSAIMLSSDVSARGVDYPDVTHVVQIGLPPSDTHYVHRLGRTGRGDKAGEGWLLVTNMEAIEVRRRLPHMPLVKDTSLNIAQVGMTGEGRLPEATADILNKVIQCTSVVDRELKVDSYMANLGSWAPDKQSLVDALNTRARYGWGMDSPPAVNSRLAAKLGLSKVAGLIISNSIRDKTSTDDRGGFQDKGRGRHSSRGFGRGFDQARFDSKRGFTRSDRYEQRNR